MEAAQLDELAVRLGVDLEVALQDGMLDAEDFLSLLEAYVDVHGEDARLLREACRAGNWAEVRERAHSLKGSSGSLGVKVLQKLAADVDNGIRTAGSGNAELIERLAGELDSFMHTARSAAG